MIHIRMIHIFLIYNKYIISFQLLQTVEKLPLVDAFNEKLIL